MSQIEEMISELKVKMIQTLGLIDVGPDDIGDDARLVGGDLGIDSIDVLELVMMIEKDYGVKIESKELGRIRKRRVKFHLTQMHNHYRFCAFILLL
jgi:acyl carrier protein